MWCRKEYYIKYWFIDIIDEVYDIFFGGFVMDLNVCL